MAYRKAEETHMAYKIFLEVVQKMKTPTEIDSIVAFQKKNQVDSNTVLILAEMKIVKYQKRSKGNKSLLSWMPHTELDTLLVDRVVAAVKQKKNPKGRDATQEALEKGRAVINQVPNKAKPITGTVFTHAHLKAMGYKMDLKSMDARNVVIDEKTEIEHVDTLKFIIEKGVLKIQGYTEHGTRLFTTIIGTAAVALSHRIKTLLIETIV